ncbi:glycosyltransferase [Aurantibacter aestuarii]|uniref:Glycosyltransferase n=1 Tax=Aurantibacter aestuarii TaxID=1266046 RepID=A0A2T1N5W4_9FLAO|nr:glycosyltransferase [Aurantibacter aestuarii]PSG86546.1 glycosyltransferase [Aurantibacter aestuarii]
MRVLQLIDSLDAGGAERVAVNFANGLQDHIDGSYLCVTRKEGLLKTSIKTVEHYLFLNKKKTIDLKALIVLKRFIKKHRIAIIHAHSTSIFTAVMVKLLGARVKIIWHDHYGKSDYLNERPKWALKFCTFFINYIFSVNDKLVEWSKNELGFKKTSYLENFVSFSNQPVETVLTGEDGYRIVCLANLRPQKDHMNLINAFHLFYTAHPKYSLHLIGKDFNDDYSAEIKQLIIDLRLENAVSIYGSRNDTFQILKQAKIAVLASKSEGLPLALLEYGYMSLPVVCTNVGDCSKVITTHENGILVSAQNPQEFAESLENLARNPILGSSFGNSLQKKVRNNFLLEQIITKVINVYKK